MNKSLFFASAAVIASLASCSNNETIEAPKGQAIGFTSMIDKNQSRAASELATANIEFFKVCGFAGDNLTFNNVEVSKTGEKWGYSPVQYWLPSTGYAFTAVGSSKGNNCSATLTSPTSKGEGFDATKGFGTIEFDNSSASGNEDVCFAVADVTTGPTITEAPNPVNMAFKHALARVKFTFTSGMSSAYTIKISDIKIDNAASSGSFDVASTVWTLGKGDDDTVSTFELGFDNIDDKELGASESGFAGYQYILPNEQELTVSFKVTVTNGNEVNDYTHSKIALGKLNYLMGNSYNFTAELNPSNINPNQVLYPIEFSAEVEAWEKDNDNVITRYEKTNPAE